MTTRAQAFAALASLAPASLFLDVYLGRPIPYYLDVYFGPPEEFFLMTPEEQSAYDDGGQLIPLLDDGNFDSILFHSASHRHLVIKWVDDPDPPSAVFLCWQQYLAYLVRRVWSSGAPDQRLSEISALIGFRHHAQTIGFLQQLNDLPYEQHDAHWGAFLQTLVGRGT